jgi:hypothetical protein
MLSTRRLAERYAAFAAKEAHGVSEVYERLALAVAASPELLEFLVSLPPERTQPNLFFAAARHLHGVPHDIDELIEIVRRDREGVRAVMLSRTTQTNEPARCAVLLPILAQLPQPLALLEVGASAGLCLLPDRYGYDYGDVRLEPATATAPVFRCRISGAVPLPAAVPQIVWRRGLDLNPVDLCSDADVAWQETLVWPGQEERAQRLRQAIALAREDPPLVVKGDLVTDLTPLIDEAPREATLVVFHTAVLAYVSPPGRARFADMIRNAPCVWLSNEAPEVFSDLAKSASMPGRFLLMRDGVPFAWAGPHGQSIDWFGTA